MPNLCRVVLLIAAMALGPASAFADPPRRVLHVSLYPYIPDAADAALTLKQGFERRHPDVIVDVTLNWNYYSLKPADKGVLYEDADVHEIDVVFLGDFITRHKLAPLPPGFTSTLGALTPRAAEAATVNGALVAVPQWLCSDFLIYRGDEAGLADVHSLADLEHALAPGQGLLMDLNSDDTLGELYLGFLLARDGSPAAALAHVGATPDPAIVARVRRLLALEPAGFGRDVGYHPRGDFYARQFARRAGGAFVGYSEMIHEVLDETAAACRTQDHCVTASDIRVAALPLQDERVRPMVWVDMFGIDAKAHGRTLTDAEDFIRYAVSVPAYRALLIPRQDEPPRYLLPAMSAAFDDADIRRAAPLYPKFRAIIDRGAVVTAPHLTAKLHDVAVQMNADLPRTH